MHSWTEIKAYCEERLSEIRAINESHQCPSSFVCIAAFMGYLSRLAYGTNNKNRREDRKCFHNFIKNFMPSKYHGKETLMYGTFRCGIIHAMSFDDELSEDNTAFLKRQPCGKRGYSKLAITHNVKYSRLCTGSKLLKDAKTNAFVLVADVLCDDLESAINNMFADPNARKNAEDFTKCQRYIDKIPGTETALPSTNAHSCSSLNADSALSATM